MMQATLHHAGQTTQVASIDWFTSIENLGARAVIFDCDGTLVDSAVAHGLCLRAAARDQGFDLTPEWYEARTGLDRKTLFVQFKRDFAPNLDIKAAIAFSIAQFETHVGTVLPLAAPVELFRQLTRRAYPVAVVTNCERQIATQSLRQVGLFENLHTLVCISDGFPAKPAPKMFEQAAVLLGVPANQVVVFEDSPQGVEAAILANMAVFEVSHQIA